MKNIYISYLIQFVQILILEVGKYIFLDDQDTRKIVSGMQLRVLFLIF